MNVDLSKTKGLIIRGGSEASLPQPFFKQDIEQDDHIKLPGVICQHIPHNWDLHFDVTLLGKASKIDITLINTAPNNNNNNSSVNSQGSSFSVKYTISALMFMGNARKHNPKWQTKQK